MGREASSFFCSDPSGRGLFLGERGGRVDTPVRSGRGLGGFLHHGEGWSSAAVCRRPAPSAGFVSETPGYLRVPGAGPLGLHSGLDSERVRPGVFPPNPPSLFQNVLRPEGCHRQETDYRPVSSEQDVKKGELQNGGPRESSKIALSGTLGCQIRPKGRLPSYPPSFGNGSVLRFCSRRENLCFSGAPFWPLTGSLDLYEGPQACEKGSASSGDTDHFLPGRFSAAGKVQAGSLGAYKDRRWAPSALGVQDQLEEVGSGSPETLGVSRGYPRPREYDLFPSSGQGGEGSRPCEIGGGSFLKEVRVGVSGGVSELHSILSPSGKTVDEATACMGEFPFLSPCPSREDCDGPGPKGCPSPLGRQGVPRVLSANSTGYSLPGPDDRCLPVGLGRGSDAPPGLRRVGRCSAGPLHQLAGVEGHSPFAAPFPASSRGEVCLFKGRQHYSPILHQETRVTSLPRALVPLPRGLGSGLAFKHSPGSSALEGGLECVGRQGFSGFPSLDRVVSGPSLLQFPLHCSWLPSGGSYGYLGESPACQLRVSLSGHQGLRDGRFLLRLEQVGLDLPIPPFSIAPGGSSTAERLRWPGVSDSSPLSIGPLVRSPSEEVPSPVSSPGGSLALSAHVRRGGLFAGGASVQPSRLDFMRASQRGDGFSEAATDLFLTCHKPSTRSQYQSTWAKFLAFLDSVGVALSEVKLCHVHNFLAQEAVVRGRAYHTVATYKCALSLPLQICCGLDLEGVCTRKFMMGVWNLRPPQPRPMPAWDLSTLLGFVRCDLFEDLREVSFSFLTQKVLVLLLVASGRRISEIANLSRVTSVRDSRTFVHWLPDFRAKWCSGFSGFTPQSPSFSEMDSQDVFHLRNCPVRALKIYLERRCSVVNRDNDDCFWTLSQTSLSAAFRSVVKASLVHVGASRDVAIYPHQTKKLAVSYCWKYFDEVRVRKELPAATGNSSIRVLKGSYLGAVPDITLPAVVPLGTIRPPG